MRQLQLFNETRESIGSGLVQALIDGPPVPETRGFAVVELYPKPWRKIMKGVVSDPIIWGIGETAPQAVDEAVRWVISSEGSDGIEDEDDLLCSGRFTIYPCSRKVMAMVQRYGGEIDFQVVGGMILLPKEIGPLQRRAKKRNIVNRIGGRNGIQ